MKVLSVEVEAKHWMLVRPLLIVAGVLLATAVWDMFLGLWWLVLGLCLFGLAIGALAAWTARRDAQLDLVAKKLLDELCEEHTRLWQERTGTPEQILSWGKEDQK